MNLTRKARLDLARSTLEAGGYFQYKITGTYGHKERWQFSLRDHEGQRVYGIGKETWRTWLRDKKLAKIDRPGDRRWYLKGKIDIEGKATT